MQPAPARREVASVGPSGSGRARQYDLMITLGKVTQYSSGLKSYLLVQIERAGVSNVARLVAFDARVNVFDEDETELEGGGTQHQEECERDNSHVTEVERTLQHTLHVTSMEVVIERVNVDEKTGHSTIHVRCPPPTMILAHQLKIEKCHCYKRCDNDEENESEEEDSEQRVDLVTPH